MKDLAVSAAILQQIHLYQMNPQNSDANKINNIDFLVLDGTSIRPNTINQVLKDCTKLMRKQVKVYLMIISDRKNQL